MYEITNCQISNGNEDDKVVPSIDYNYSSCPVLSPFSIMFMERGRRWEAVARNDVSNRRRKRGSLGTKGISNHKTSFCDLYCS